MPALVRQVTRQSSNSRRVRQRTQKKFRGSSARIPRAISTRGTPDGYYEIPVRTLLKVYCTNGQGMFNTNQNATSAPIGVGFQGFGLWTSLDTVTMYLGASAVSAQIQRSVAGFSEIANVFDQCKIASMTAEFWFEMSVKEQGGNPTNGYGAPDLYVAQDKDDCLPPGSIDEILQYQKVQRMPGTSQNMYRNKCYPYVADINATSANESSTTTTISGSSPAGYMNTSKPAAAHMGWKGFMSVDSNGGNDPFMLNILVTQVRRYKMAK